MLRSRAVRRVLGFLACGILLAGFAGCGGGTRQDADEPSGTFEVRVVRSSFPAHQSISSPATMRIAVRNDGGRTIPDVAVSIDGFTRQDQQPGLADPNRPVWVVDRGPVGGDTAYVETWALGALRAGATREFTWHVVPVLPGTHVVTWTVAAGLDGNAKAHTASGGRPTGTFTVHVSDAPAQATVDPRTGAVVRK